MMWPLLKAFMGPFGAGLQGNTINDMGSVSDLTGLAKEYAALRAKRMGGLSAPQGVGAPPVSAQASAPSNMNPDGTYPSVYTQAAPMEGLKVFDMLKGFSGASGPSAPAASADTSGSMDNMSWPFGPIGAPQASASEAVPMPRARPQDAPQASGEPDTSFFMRNALMMRDPTTNAFIDPMGASSVRGPDLISKMMGYLHNKVA